MIQKVIRYTFARPELHVQVLRTVVLEPVPSEQSITHENPLTHDLLSISLIRRS